MSRTPKAPFWGELSAIPKIIYVKLFLDVTKRHDISFHLSQRAQQFHVPSDVPDEKRPELWCKGDTFCPFLRSLNMVANDNLLDPI